jgi:hypothetical protein
MLDIVAAHEHELALPVEIERIDDAEARLACPSTARQMKLASKNTQDDE